MTRRIEGTFTKRLSLDSSALSQRLSTIESDEQHGDTNSHSSGQKILRYSYNLGKQKNKVHRAASIAGNLTTLEGNVAKILLNRKELPRIEKMEKRKEITNDKVVPVSPINYNHPPLSKQLAINDEQQHDEVQSNSPSSGLVKNQPILSTDLSKCSDSDGISTEFPRKLKHSDSVPNLRSTVHRLEREDFIGSFTSEVQPPRPVSKLRRAARRLGVSLSSEELYHKQRRNGVCNEIDLAAENRKLLRVLNKRF